MTKNTKTSTIDPHRIRFRMRIVRDDEIAIGPGKVDLLEAIASEGSISGAARRMSMSYRRAWLLLDQMNRSLSTPATVSAMGGQAGGGCMLTSVGEEIVRLYRDIERQALIASAPQIEALDKLLKR